LFVFSAGCFPYQYRRALSHRTGYRRLARHLYSRGSTLYSQCSVPTSHRVSLSETSEFLRLDWLAAHCRDSIRQESGGQAAPLLPASQDTEAGWGVPRSVRLLIMINDVGCASRARDGRRKEIGSYEGPACGLSHFSALSSSVKNRSWT